MVANAVAQHLAAAHTAELQRVEERHQTQKEQAVELAKDLTQQNQDLRGSRTLCS